MLISRRTLNEHLKRLEEQEIIHKDENPQIGKKRYIRLTSKAILKKSLDILEGVNPKNVTIRHKKLLRLIIGMICQSYIGHMKSDGTIEDYEHRKGPGRLTTSLTTEFPGISIADVKNQNIHTGISYEEITELINKLDREKITIPVLTEDGEIRIHFNSGYEKLTSFINRCFGILWLLVVNMKHKWFSLRKKPTSEEISWFISIVGKKEMNSFFTGLEEERKLATERRRIAWESDLKLGKIDRAMFQAALKTNLIDKEFVKNTDISISKMTRELQERYHELGLKYPVFYELMMEMICPPFLKN